MKRASTCAFLAEAVLISVSSARLVPVPFWTNPPVQRLTRYEAKEHCDTNFFGQCHGISVVPMSRLAVGDSHPVVMVVSDQSREKLAYGIAYQKWPDRGVDSFALTGRGGLGGDRLCGVAGVAIDTFKYESDPTKLYVYVASSKSFRVMRFRFDMAAMSLSYMNDVHTPGLGLLADVSAARAEEANQVYGTYVAIINAALSKVTILGIEKTSMAPVTLAELGQPGSGDDEFLAPNGVCIAPDHTHPGLYDVYVADKGNSRIVHLSFDPDGPELTWQGVYESPGAQFSDVTVNPFGYVYALDYAGNSVMVFRRDLNELKYSYDACGFTQPREVTIFGDQLAVCEKWSDSSGIQYLRIVPEIKDLQCGGPFDATRDSIHIGFRLDEMDGYVNVDIIEGYTVQRHLVRDTLLSVDEPCDLVWDGLDDSGRVALPGTYRVRVRASFRRGETDTNLVVRDTIETLVKGTRIPAVIDNDALWTPANEPYVLAGHSLDVGPTSTATLTIDSGVRVMFAPDAERHGIVVHGDDRLVANGTAQDSVYFMPHRKMFWPYDTLDAGVWGGLHVEYHSNGAQFSHCVFENGGGVSWDSAVVFGHEPNQGYSLDFDNCHFRGSVGHAIAFAEDFGCERMDIDSCRFEYCGDYPIHKLKAKQVAGVCASCTFEHNRVPGLMVHNTEAVDERIEQSCTWPCRAPGWHYDLDGDLYVRSDTGYPVLTIAPGVTIRMPQYGEIKVGYHNGPTKDSGAIVAEGTPGAPIVFEGLSDAEWDGVHLSYDPSNLSSFRYCTFKDGTGQSRTIHNYVHYHPLVYCNEVGASFYRCRFQDAYRQPGDECGTGIYVKECEPQITGCKFLNDECALLVDLGGQQTFTAESCRFSGGEVGARVASVHEPPNFTLYHSNLWDNTSWAVSNAEPDSVDARYNWWGPHGQGANRGKPGEQGNDDFEWYVKASPWLTDSVVIWSHDVAAVEIVRPDGLMEPGSIVPRAIARNAMDAPLPIRARLTVGQFYSEEVAETLAAHATDTVVFPAAEFPAGTYQTSFKVMLLGDEDPANDSIADTVELRDSIDVVAVSVLAPIGTITIEDSIEPVVRIASLSDSALSVPVKLFIDTVLTQTETASVAGHETVDVAFDARTFTRGQHNVCFAACLASDDDRSNDTTGVGIEVKPGDFWTERAAAPVDSGRLCWDGSGSVYAAERGTAVVARYDITADSWQAVSSPPVEQVAGMTALNGRVYVLGVPAQDRASGANPAVGAAGSITPGDDRTSLPVQTTPIEAGPVMTQEPELLRYDPTGDSWLYVTTCTGVSSLGSGSGIVGDDGQGIFLIPGGQNKVWYYPVAQDSWTSVQSPVLDYHGAADWSRNRLYALADSLSLFQYIPGPTPWWIPVPGPGTEPEPAYSSGLCCDRAGDRLLAIMSAGGSDSRVGGLDSARPDTRLWSHQNLPANWQGRATLATEFEDCGLCYAGTRAFCLDGDGGFWRYRPEPVYDVAAAGIVVPDTVPRESTFTPMAAVQNSWQDSVTFGVALHVGTYHDSTVVTVGPQAWDTVAFTPTWLQPGLVGMRLSVALAGDSVPANDTLYDTLFVRYRHDAAAVQVQPPYARIAYDSLFHPAGQIENRSDESLVVRVQMTIEPDYEDWDTVELSPLTQAGVSFDTCRLRVGSHEIELQVFCDSDEVKANDSVFGSVDVITGDYWRTVASSPVAPVQLAADTSQGVLAAADEGTDFSRYDMAGDSWTDLSASPLAETKSVCRTDGRVYALGMLGDWLDDREHGAQDPTDANDARVIGLHPDRLSARAGAGRDGPPAIVRFHVASNVWDTVTINIPAPVGDGSCLFATDDSTLYLLSEAGGTNLRRYDVNQDNWVVLERMPGQPQSVWTAGTQNFDGNLYVLTGQTGSFYAYDIAADSWSALSSLNAAQATGRAALSFDPVKGQLYAFWPVGLGPCQGFYEYDFTEQTWVIRQSYPGTLTQPGLAAQDGKVYGSSGEPAGTFARYYPIPELDVAAETILSLPDTVRYDSMVQPAGVAHNLSEVPVWCTPRLTRGSMVVTLSPVYLVAGQTDTVVFGPLTLAPGRKDAEFRVICTGDANTENDTVSQLVQVEAPWEPRSAPLFYAGRLDSDTGTAVFGANRQGNAVASYGIGSDEWQPMASVPFTAGALDLTRYDGTLYALGVISTDRPRKPSQLRAEALTDNTGQPAIYRLASGDTAWNLVTDSLPTALSPNGCCWIVATGDGIYLAPGIGPEFYRFDTTNGWVQKESVPVAVSYPSAIDWDRADTIFLLTRLADSSALFSYSLSGDTWHSLPRLPVQPGAGLALAAEPEGDAVLALVPAESGSARLYAYSRSGGTWALKPTPGWVMQDGAALAYAGDAVYALTGRSDVTPSWYWCFDPAFSTAWGKGMDGVAGTGQRPSNRYSLNCIPNPFTHRTMVHWQVPVQANAALKVFNTAGRQVKTLIQGRQKPGTYTTTWSGTDDQGRRVAAGVYFVRLDAEGSRLDRKVVMTR